VRTILAIGDGSMSATVGNTVITSRLIQGKFPDYTNFFPKSFSTKVVASRNELISGLRRIQLIARENKDNIRISFSHETGIEISTGETQIGNGRTIVKASLEWNEERVGLNVVFLLEVLNVIREDFVSLDFETPLSPILVHGVPAATPESQAFRHIIMPLKI
jgi:DNA polymerase-3 subunit beta